MTIPEWLAIMIASVIVAGLIPAIAFIVRLWRDVGENRFNIGALRRELAEMDSQITELEHRGLTAQELVSLLRVDHARLEARLVAMAESMEHMRERFVLDG